MSDFRTGYLYSLAPIHCGGEGDLGNVLDIAREVHTDFPYIPGSSLRGGIREEVRLQDSDAADRLFGKELQKNGDMGVHQVWFGDARLLWVPMRTMSLNGGTDVFAWVSCHSLIRDHAIVAGKPVTTFPDTPIGDRPGTYIVADAEVEVKAWPQGTENTTIALDGWPDALKDSAHPVWSQNRIILSDADFQTLMEHALWTQIRNKIQDETDDPSKNPGSAEIFWTDVCIPRDTILYFSWGYKLLSKDPVTKPEHHLLMDTINALLQVGGQANVGRGWVHGWVNRKDEPKGLGDKSADETQANDETLETPEAAQPQSAGV
ncbi:type III-B CRISPR module RAMP protein Cmr4 [Nodosilinea sp. LEGE 07088]|uniref:RAMP superfamily CRISPR-associated protein n=1 Tax=Nodosilinea sp. LEGE 07088 TaxID=2777968 RepID=UPI00188192B2|nr:RAMP superfamily CRISPR-associated protein [Nodosilinea sp. LEGE 07088]MBE9138185.1 type III-B CRISPR module RAMP protein Cmr4 [Nodosilinea sp. LEGE 07088]